MRLFCDEQWSCFVLNLFDFCKREKELFIVVQKISAFSGTRGRALGIVYPNMLATNGIKWWRRVFELFSKFSYVARFDLKGLSLK